MTHQSMGHSSALGNRGTCSSPKSDKSVPNLFLYDCKSESNHTYYSEKNEQMKEKKYASGSRYWNIPVLTSTGTFVVYQVLYNPGNLHGLEQAMMTSFQVPNFCNSMYIP